MKPPAACFAASIWPVLACTIGAQAGTPRPQHAAPPLSGVAVPFEANIGQQDGRVAFTAHAAASTVFVTRDGQLVHSFAGRQTAGRGIVRRRGPGWSLSETLVSARPQVRGSVASATRISRFVGNDPTRWQSSVPAFDRVMLGRAWPGVDVELAARGGAVEKLFTVAPGADVRRIAVRLRGATRIELAATGALVAHTGNGPVTFSAPRAWQDVGGKHKPVRVAYTLAGSRYGFRLGEHDPAHAVVIDPIVQSTYLGGSGADAISAMAVDSAGNVFVGGNSNSANFPGTAGGAQSTLTAGNSDGVIVKLNPGLTAIVQATYFGGNDYDTISSLAIDAAGEVYGGGGTLSTNLAGTAGSAQPANAGYVEGFVVKLNNALTGLIRTTYIGGTNSDNVNAIALDASGNVFVTGITRSTVFPFVAGGAQFLYGGGFQDGFVVKFNGALTSALQATWLGGVDWDYARAIAVDGAGNVFVAGQTSSYDFPATFGSAQAAYAGNTDGFVAKLNNSLTGFIRSTFVGGSASEIGWSMALDAGGNVFVSGLSDSTNFPATSGGAIPTGGGVNGFVTKLNNGLTAYVKSSYLAADSYSNGNFVAVDSAGNVFVTGNTASVAHPNTAGGAQSSYGGGGYDAFVTRFNNALTSVYQSTYLGGSGTETAYAIRVDPAGDVYVAGNTASTNFPGTFGGAQAVNSGGSNDGFVTKLTHGLHDAANSTANNDGDPHMLTTDGLHYDFQGGGEYVALHDPGGVEIQTRQTPVQTAANFLIADPYDQIQSCVSVNTAVAARVGTHRVTLEPNFVAYANPSGMQLRVDGVVTALPPAGINLGSGNRIVPAPMGGGMEIDFSDGMVLIANPTWWAYMSLWYLNVDVFHVDAAAGLMGNVAPGSWLPALPDGSSVGPMPATIPQRYAVLYGTFGNAWRVSNTSTLFDYKPGQSTGTFTFPSWPPQSAPCRLPRSPFAPAKPLDAKIAQTLCDGIKDKYANADCVSDVILTGEKTFARSYFVTQTLKAGATATIVRHAPHVRSQKQSVIYVATVTSIGTNKKVPIGTVRFSADGGVVRAEVELDKDGRAIWNASGLGILDHDVVGTYVPAKKSVFLTSSGLDPAGHGTR